MTVNVKAVIWDLDGTLLNTLEDLAASTNAALASCGMPTHTVDEVRMFVGNGIGKLMVDAIAGEGVDYNYVLALGILYSSLYIGIMLVVDILYGALDPRIRVSAKGGANE